MVPIGAMQTIDFYPRRKDMPRAQATTSDNHKKTRQEEERDRLLDELATIGGKLTAEEDILFRGTKLVLPETMTLTEAITFLKEKVNEDNREMTFERTFMYRPHDGARATMLAMKRAFGAVSQRGVPGFFGETPPSLVSVPVSATETEQVPWGGLGVVHLPGMTFYLQATKDREFGQVFHISATGPRKYRFHVEGLFKLIGEELERNSLYRGKAFDGKQMPSFLDLSGVNPEKVIYSDETTRQLEANIWSLLRYPDEMQALGVPLKRAVLLEGPYGTGKTLAAYLTARVAVENHWSFLLCRPVQDKLLDVMATARLYQPAVVFFEDVDTITEGEDDQLRKLLDIMDGIQAKGARIIVVVTTNHVERIHKAMVRPGRLDAVIHVGPLDAHGVQRMIQATVPSELLSPDIEWDQVTDSFKGFLPAFCREAIDRTVRYNVSRNQGQATKLMTEDFVDAAAGLRPQLELMEGAAERQLKDTITEAFTGLMDEVVYDRMHGAEIRDEDDDYRGQIRVKS